MSDKFNEILHSKRANLQYLEHCRVMVKDGRVLFLEADPKRKDNSYWNIPVANTYAVLLGTGTSITQAAVRMLAETGVVIGFSGTGATPLVAGTEIEWLSPQSEYRPTEYVQQWLKFWFDDGKRCEIGRYFQLQRIKFLRMVWEKDVDLKSKGIDLKEHGLERALKSHAKATENAQAVAELLAAEGRLAKELYRHVANCTGFHGFVRDPEDTDAANRFLNHGNYLAYGAAASCLWCLGIPHGFAVMHGKTRRGALVFDVADLIKDSVILPRAFIAAADGLNEREFRENCLEAFTKHSVLEFMFNVVKAAAAKGAEL